MDVLLVDDDLVDREIIKRILLKQRDLDIRITEAATVNEGLELYRKNHFDIILLDYRMPQRDGIEMLSELRRTPKATSTAIVMTSTLNDEQLALDCLKAGAQDFLVKSEITTTRLRSAVLHAQTRFELEKQLHLNYQNAKQLAKSDSLTGLADRYLFEELLNEAVANNLMCRSKLALLLINLDNFKDVNDSYNHEVGNLLLKEIATRIQACLRGNNLVARLGGDEFAIAIINLKSTENANQVAIRIIKVIEEPFEIADVTLKSTASIGIAIHPDNGRTTDELIKYSELAMYQAKKIGRKQICIFEDDMRKHVSKRLLIVQELSEAEEKQQLLLYFQPIVNPENNEVLGFEALLRWEIEGRIRAPDEFIHIAEETGQIINIGRWVIKEAIATLAQWSKQSDKGYTIAINLSAVQLSDPELISYISELINTYEIAADLIEFELTETALLVDTQETQNSIFQLHKLGCRIALDDFGTGYSSVSHLQKFPIDTVKIDKSLMPNGKSNGKDEALIRGLVSMVRTLGLNIIAEGVETEDNVKLCKTLGISKIQGYFYSKPLSYGELEFRFFKSIPLRS